MEIKQSGKIKERDGIGTRNGKSQSKIKMENSKIMVKLKRDEIEILQAMLYLLRKSLYGSGYRKLCKS